MSVSIKNRIAALEGALHAQATKVDIVGFEVISYENWPTVTPDDWRETSPGSDMWLTPADDLETHP